MKSVISTYTVVYTIALTTCCT